jgi:hypothetical protein
LERTLHLALAVSHVAPTYAIIDELVDKQGAQPTSAHAIQACELISRSGGKCLELILLDLLLPSDHVDLERVLTICCAGKDMGKALRILIQNNDVSDEGSSLADHASKFGAWAALEVCLELLPWETPHARFASNLLVALARNTRKQYGIWPSAMERVLGTLLPQVSFDQVKSIMTPLDRTHPLYLYLIEHVSIRHAIIKHVPACTRDSFLWLLRRNPNKRAHILTTFDYNNTWLVLDDAMQASLNQRLLAHTSLANSLIQLVLQYHL